MVTLSRRLPNLGSLVAFEAVARHLSITRAADELALTQAAVSRKIRALEEDLGVTLFRRLHRALRLTQEGERLHAAVSGSLYRVAEAAEGLRRQGSPAQVSVATSIAFATFWLMPRLAKFSAEHPDVELRITAFDPYVDPESEGADAAIRFGRGRWPGLAATHLFDEEIFPVCSPQYRDRHPELDGVEALRDQTLLYMDVGYTEWTDWTEWFRKQGVSAPPARRGLKFNTYTMVIQAAVAGQGVALGWRHLVDEFLEAGQLLRPIPDFQVADGAYYLVRPDDAPESAEVQRFVDWLLAEVRTSGD